MTVSSQTAKVSYAGNGSTKAFAVNFYFLADSHLKVVLRAADGTETVKTLTTDYTVSGAGNPAGGTVTMVVVPASGQTLVIVRNVPLTQETDYQANDPFPAESHERALDKLTMGMQQVQEEIDRCAKLPVTDPASADALVADLIRLADSADNIDTVAGHIANVDTVATHAANVDTVATNIANVNTVATDMAAVTTVANDLNEPVSEIETVAGSIANVNAVGNNIANVNAVAGNATNINAVNANKSNIDAVAGNATNINAVNANATNINAVNANKTNIDTVATNISSVNTNASNIAAINTNAANIVDIQNAEENAETATQKAAEAAASAASAALITYGNLIMHPNKITESLTIPDGYNAFFIDPVEFGPNVTITGLGNSTLRGV